MEVPEEHRKAFTRKDVNLVAIERVEELKRRVLEMTERIEEQVEIIRAVLQEWDKDLDGEGS